MVNTAAPTGEEQAIARRLRTLLSASDSLDVLTEADHSQLVGLHTVDAAGRLLVRLPGDARLAVAVACAPYGDLAAIVELTDVAPVPMRDRVRGRARLTSRTRRSTGATARGGRSGWTSWRSPSRTRWPWSRPTC
jgi:hypothetical protein